MADTMDADTTYDQLTEFAKLERQRK